MFTAPFLSFLIYGALIWCGLSAAGLTAMLIHDLLGGRSW